MNYEGDLNGGAVEKSLMLEIGLQQLPIYFKKISILEYQIYPYQTNGFKDRTRNSMFAAGIDPGVPDSYLFQVPYHIICITTQ